MAGSMLPRWALGQRMKAMRERAKKSQLGPVS